MLEVLTDFVEELRRAQLPISAQETMDAASAVRVVLIEDRMALRAALASTLVKSSEHRQAFYSTFDVFFSQKTHPFGEGDLVGTTQLRDEQGTESTGETSKARIDEVALRVIVLAALSSGDHEALRRAARLSVAVHAGIESGRPVGISYYLYRTLRGLDLDGLLDALLLGGVGRDELSIPEGAFGEALLRQEYAQRIEVLRALIEEAIMASLVADRGMDAVAQSLRRTALGDVDFMHATRAELAEIRRALYPLARLLAARLARRRRHRRRGSLDFRATIRRSLSTGGVPFDPHFARPHLAKPELVVIADVSGSVASFARFTLQLVFAIASQFSKVRSFVFVDGIDEVTAIFKRSKSLTDAIERVGAEANVMHRDGHSDYGNAFSIFNDRYVTQLNARTDVIILGDARNNYHPAQSDLLAEIARRSRHLYWLNPEPKTYWGSGDSIIAQYAPHCDAVFECRNLHQLEAFVSFLA